MACTGRVLESKVALALACAAGGAACCPATLFVPWATERLPTELATLMTANHPLWVLKRDALSNGEGVFFPQTAAEAEEIIASQRRVRNRNSCVIGLRDLAC